MTVFNSNQKSEVLNHLKAVSCKVPIQIVVTKRNHNFMLYLYQNKAHLIDLLSRLSNRPGEIENISDLYLEKLLDMCLKLGRPWIPNK